MFITQLTPSQREHTESVKAKKKPILLLSLYPVHLYIYCPRVFRHAWPDLIRPPCVCVSSGDIIVQGVCVDRGAKLVMFALGFSSVIFVDEAGSLPVPPVWFVLRLVDAVESNNTLRGRHLVVNAYITIK